MSGYEGERVEARPQEVEGRAEADAGDEEAQARLAAAPAAEARE